MVKKILSQRKVVVIRERRIEFDLKECEGAGATFPADDNWRVRFTPCHEKSQRETYEYCASHPEAYAGPFQRVLERRSVENAVAICECGCKIELWDQYQGASACSGCGRWHNLFGQTLLEPRFWQEE